MTTVAYINGVLASDSHYYNTDEDFTLLFNKSENDCLRPPKIIKFNFSSFSLLYGCAGRSDLMALSIDYFIENYSKITKGNFPNHLSTLAKHISRNLTYKQKNTNDEYLLELIFVINDNPPETLFYNPSDKLFYKFNDQFPSIGSGSDFIKSKFDENIELSCIELVTYAVENDPESGGEIYSTCGSQDTLPIRVISNQQKPDTFDNLKELMRKLGKIV